ncbi:MAG: hypothetical protein JJU36_01910 [Phycisphaeraceae bacterium]|nr:hypothetical protein [Phycisphaeraceae bacterium]
MVTYTLRLLPVIMLLCIGCTSRPDALADITQLADPPRQPASSILMHPAPAAETVEPAVQAYADPGVSWYIDWRDRRPSVVTGAQPVTVEVHTVRTFDRVSNSHGHFGFHGAYGTRFSETRSSTVRSTLIR